MKREAAIEWFKSTYLLGLQESLYGVVAQTDPFLVRGLIRHFLPAVRTRRPHTPHLLFVLLLLKKKTQ
jgi:hypothetical protein